MNGLEVFKLQVLLNKTTTPELEPTGYFDYLTEEALKKWQTKQFVTGYTDSSILQTNITESDEYKAVNSLAQHQHPALRFSDRNGASINLVVVSSSMQTDAMSSLDFFSNGVEPVSCHFLIDLDGQVIKMVPLEKAAWHAGMTGELFINQSSISIVLVNGGQLKKEEGFLWFAGQKVLYEKDVYGHPVRIDGKQYQPYTTEQFTTLKKLIQVIKSTIPKVRLITLGELIDIPNPGPAFPIEKFNMLKEEAKET